MPTCLYAAAKSMCYEERGENDDNDDDDGITMIVLREQPLPRVWSRWRR